MHFCKQTTSEAAEKRITAFGRPQIFWTPNKLFFGRPTHFIGRQKQKMFAKNRASDRLSCKSVAQKLQKTSLRSKTSQKEYRLMTNNVVSAPPTKHMPKHICYVLPLGVTWNFIISLSWGVSRLRAPGSALASRGVVIKRTGAWFPGVHRGDSTTNW